jgi:hypothetical protein
LNLQYNFLPAEFLMKSKMAPYPYNTRESGNWLKVKAPLSHLNTEVSRNEKPRFSHSLGSAHRERWLNDLIILAT